MVTLGKRADLLALVCDVYCNFVTFSFVILGQVWYLIVSIPDPCCLSYFLPTKQLVLGRVSSVGRASAFGAGGRGFESRGRTIPKV